jgi:hypothetical protein
MRAGRRRSVNHMRVLYIGPLVLNSSFSSQIPGSIISPILIFKGAIRALGGSARCWADSFVDSLADRPVFGLCSPRRSRSEIVKVFATWNDFFRVVMVSTESRSRRDMLGLVVVRLGASCKPPSTQETNVSGQRVEKQRGMRGTVAQWWHSSRQLPCQLVQGVVYLVLVK